MSDIYCSAASWLGVDWDRCKGSTVAKKIDTPVGVGCASSSTGPKGKDVVEEDIGKPDVSQDGKEEIPFLDVYEVPEIGDAGVCEDIPDFYIPDVSEIFDVSKVEVGEAGMDIKGEDVEEIPEKYLLWEKSITVDYDNCNYNLQIGNPVIVDINGDNKQELIFLVEYTYGCTKPIFSNRVYILDSEGNSLPGWPSDNFCSQNHGVILYGMTFEDTIAVGDLDGDGDRDLACWWKENNGEGKIKAVHHDGTPLAGWPITGKELPSHLTCVDLDGDGSDEVLGIGLHEVYIFGPNGSPVILKSPDFNVADFMPNLAIGNLDGGNDLEIVKGTQQEWSSPDAKFLIAWKSNGDILSGFPIQHSDFGLNCNHPSGSCKYEYTIILADVEQDGGLEIIAKSYDQILIINPDGSLKYHWQVPPCSQLLLAGDTNLSGGLELIFNNWCEEENKKYNSIEIYSYQGSLVSSIFPPADPVFQNLFRTSFLLGNFNEDSQMELLGTFSSEDSFPVSLRIFDPKSTNELYQLIFGNPYSGLHLTDPVIGDLNGNGDPEIVQASYDLGYMGRLKVWEIPTNGKGISSGGWFAFGHDFRQSFNTEMPLK